MGIGFFYFTTQLMQDGLGFSPVQAGLGFLPMTVVNFVVALGVPKVAKGFSNASLLSAGIAVTLVGMVWLSRIDTGDPYLLAVGLPMLLIGAGGQGLAFGPLTTAGVAGVAPGDAAAAATRHAAIAITGSSVFLALALATALAVIVPARRTPNDAGDDRYSQSLSGRAADR